MRTVWRLCAARHAATAMSGHGARLYGGRWNDRGVAMIYCSGTLSLAVLELLVHSPVLPTGMVAIQIDLPDSVGVDVWPASTLPTGWRATPAPARLQTIGSAWVRRGTAVALEVPSAIVEVEHNVLLNPAHPDLGRLVVHRPRPFPFDARSK